MNWKVRLNNKTWLATFIALVVSFVYQVLSMFGIIPAITQETILQAVNIVLLFLTGIGVVMDPTTTGITDSARAKAYTLPNPEK